MSDFFNGDNKLQSLLHYISLIGMYFLLYGIFYLLLDLTIGRMEYMKQLVFFGVPGKLVIFTIINVFIIYKFFKISSPYKK